MDHNLYIFPQDGKRIRLRHRKGILSATRLPRVRIFQHIQTITTMKVDANNNIDGKDVRI
jgi:hypothetical protein